MEGEDKYSFQQNILVTYKDILATYNGADGIRPAGAKTKLQLNDSLYNYQVVNNFLQFSFTVQINPPNAKCKRIVIKNICTGIFTASGYTCELACPYFRYPIQFLDSQSALVKYEEYVNKNLASQQLPFTVTIPCGDVPSAYNPGNDTYTGGFLTGDLLLNPCISFSLVFEYY